MRISTKRKNIFQKNKTEILELKNTIMGLKTFTRGIKLKTCEFEDRLLKSNQKSMKKKE